ncbi:hypothetical protein A584_29001 [Pseudomonas syringae pv. theae ICMP 3923]|nr:hypothetical protein [Pseudomonas syringae]EPM65028.1 hypothetical protein A584_29001 [Pseudomonas syringae pv. theae ICMP 3923]KPZ29962.1 hypothetical protein AN901_200034 [Pseudomonas syringae pv. theae]MBL3831435.1 hypothetical protein [Pseudomonas syringae pv. theae]MBL3834540.1 hypothetical protein [Pseudomonas syringae pv. theae]MBL3868172.1 hypothetical protein [Pseudomonas syringae pv. theae]
MKNTEFKCAISYYDLVPFQIHCTTSREQEILQGIFSDYLEPFFRRTLDQSLQPTYTISLTMKIEEVDVSGWELIEFLNDEAIEDFRFGYCQVISPTDRRILNPINSTLFHISGNHIEINYATSESLTKDFLRVLKQLVITDIERKGGFVLHASAVSIGNNAICFLGDKGKGKTTCLLEAMSSENCNYLSNDRLLVLPTASGYKAYGWFEQLRVIQANTSNKKIVKVLDNYSIERIASEPALLSTVMLPDCDSLYPADISFRDVIQSQLLSPDPRRPKWLGLSNPGCFDLEKFISSMRVELLPWSYAKRSKIYESIERKLLYV